jgi:hypothetical protein
MFDEIYDSIAKSAICFINPESLQNSTHTSRHLSLPERLNIFLSTGFYYSYIKFLKPLILYQTDY